ncbi:MAG: hypothetical protein O2888_05680 [Chloroflexi bacterium]|nr:hypothetical protein [Chloroflexota bacterium]
MQEISLTRHVVIFLALVVNLWVGGDLIQAWAGPFWRTAFELGLILGWMTIILGMRAPLPWRRAKSSEADERGRR